MTSSFPFSDHFSTRIFFIAGFIHQVYWGPLGPESLDRACEAVEAQQPQQGPGGGSAGKPSKPRHASGEEASGPLGQEPLCCPCPRPTTPGFGTRLQESTLKAMRGIIKMTNWRIETIYAFVYLKILPLFIETRKMGLGRPEGAWEAAACMHSPCRRR